jgi:broad specificity phosphatase PhoE
MKLPGLLLLLLLAALPARADEAAWQALSAGGHVAVLRHANAPGPMPDPPGFLPGDCATQRNLDDQGRAEATAIGQTLKEHKVKVGGLLSSAWCRCLETARLLGLGAPTVEPALNNVHGALGDEATQLPALRALVAGWKGRDTLLLVSHGSTISGALGAFPEQGEILVFAPDAKAERGFRLVGRIPAPTIVTE